MDRNHAIDVFRGLAIILMVFFTVILKLSADLPDLLRHNVRSSFHVGDLVLPMFLFASGLSLAYYAEKRKEEDRKSFPTDIAGRFGKLAMVGVSLSYFSAYGFLEMDEVMLSALLFLACMVLAKIDWKIILALVLLIDLSYLGLMHFERTDIFVGHYLGGYPAAVYYLPVMLMGLVLGKGMLEKGLWCRKNRVMMLAVFLFFLLFLVFVPTDKLSVTPSFTMVSILMSFLIFAALVLILPVPDMTRRKRFSLKGLEYVGKKPLRYWILMYICFIIPARGYLEYSHGAFPLHLHWPIGIAISMGVMILLWGLSRLLDRYI